MSVLPIAKWLPRYERANFRFDIVAGLTVAALVVPKSLGYAGIAKVPIQNGLYAAAAAALIYALFGTSKQISTGPSSALAAVAASAVVTTGLPEDEAPELVAAIAVMAGVMFLLLAVFKMGWVSQFLSKAVITGFLFGAAIEVVVGELPKITGTSAEGENVWQKFDSWLEGADGTEGTTLLIGAIALATIVVLRFVAPRVPGALVLVVGGLLASAWLDLEDRGVATVGDVPRGLPAPEIPGISVFQENFGTITVAALALLLIGFSQTAGDARLFASRHGYRIDVNQESVAQGMSNIGAGVFQGIPVSTSLSASSLNDSAGARTQMASVVNGVVIVLTLLLFAPLFSDLPKPVLAAIIIDAVVFGMMDVREMRRLWRVTRSDFWIAIAAILGVLTGGVLAGVIIGIVLSLGWLVWVNATPSAHELGRRPGTTTFRSLDAHPDGETYPGVLVMRFDGGLYFVTTEVASDWLREHVVMAEEPIQHIVVDLEAVNFVDSQGSGELGHLLDVARAGESSVDFARMQAAVHQVLEADGVIERLGEEHLHASVDDAVKAVLARSARSNGDTPAAGPQD
jgi:high affinity sulfate transporter 1